MKKKGTSWFNNGFSSTVHSIMVSRKPITTNCSSKHEQLDRNDSIALTRCQFVLVSLELQLITCFNPVMNSQCSTSPFFRDISEVIAQSCSGSAIKSPPIWSLSNKDLLPEDDFLFQSNCNHSASVMRGSFIFLQLHPLSRDK